MTEIASLQSPDLPELTAVELTAGSDELELSGALVARDGSPPHEPVAVRRVRVLESELRGLVDVLSSAGALAAALGITIEQE